MRQILTVILKRGAAERGARSASGLPAGLGSAAGPLWPGMRYRRDVPSLLVLWDVDHTLIDAGRAGWRAYQLAFGQLFGRDVPLAPSMAGRTDRAIALETLALAGVPHPRTQVDAFQRVLAQVAPSVADVVRDQGRVLPGAAEAVRALAAAAWPGRPAPAPAPAPGTVSRSSSRC